IGHFIWYPKGQRGPFDESFPKLVRFVSAHGAKLPPFLLVGHDTFCPWNSRVEFQQAIDSPKMKQLRQFLVDTIDLQAQFLIARLQDALPKMMAQASDRENLQRQFDRVASSVQGCYALVDYINFKGEGKIGRASCREMKHSRDGLVTGVQTCALPILKQLRQFLVDTIDLQAQFLIARLQDALPKMMAQASDRENLQRQFDRVASSVQGCYALVDYINFKGEG